MKALCILGVVVLGSSVVSAQRPTPTTFADVAPYLALAGGQGLDAGSTIWFLRGTRCVEGNPLYGPHPSTATILLPKVALVGAVSVAMWAANHYARPSERKSIRVLNRILGYTVGGIGAGNGIRNLVVCRAR